MVHVCVCTPRVCICVCAHVCSCVCICMCVCVCVCVVLAAVVFANVFVLFFIVVVFICWVVGFSLFLVLYIIFLNSRRNLNAFLNSGEGGTVYLGVVDDGKIHGINMTRLQVPHAHVL